MLSFLETRGWESGWTPDQSGMPRIRYVESSSQERWVSNDTVGSAISSLNISMDYVHQNLIAVGFSIVGGGSGFKAPQIVSRSLNGTVNATLSTAPIAIWLNSGAQWRVNNILEGSNASQRWETPVSAGYVNFSDILPVLLSSKFCVTGFCTTWRGFGLYPSKNKSDDVRRTVEHCSKFIRLGRLWNSVQLSPDAGWLEKCSEVDRKFR